MEKWEKLEGQSATYKKPALLLWIKEFIRAIMNCSPTIAIRARLRLDGATHEWRYGLLSR